jgi:hypothetical protein
VGVGVPAEVIDRPVDVVERVLPPGQYGCHLLEVVVIEEPTLAPLKGWAGMPLLSSQPRFVRAVMSLCGRYTEDGVLLTQNPNPLGPKCDGPVGCSNHRCPACATAWMERNLT